jgi:hypothetical protein
MKRLVSLRTLPRFLFSFAYSNYLFFNFLLQNFVGLSVLDGYIACGSESNEV